MALEDVVRQSLRRTPGSSPYYSEYGVAAQPVISIFDEFSQSCFARVANLHATGPIKPELDLDRLSPEMLLAESAWNGNDGRWRYLLTSSSGPRSEFRHLVSACRERNIPTVFWNKEDPVHYDDFIEAAELMDVVLTTDGDLIDTYRKRLGHDRVGLLRFAAEPSIHNSRRVDGYREGDIAFGGQYFRHKYPERRDQVNTLFAAAREFSFAIFSRMLGGDANYQFPDEYTQYIRGSLPYSEMVREYRRHKIFINVNSVTTSTTMCARRVFELSAAKTVTVTMTSPAIQSVFSLDEVPNVASTWEAREVFKMLVENPRERGAIAQRAWRRVAQAHTMQDRMVEIREMLGVSQARRPVDVELHVEAAQVTEELLDDLNSQTLLGQENASIWLTLHGSDIPLDGQAGKIRLVSAGSPSIPSPDYVGHVSGSQRYGRFYLEDLILNLEKFLPEPIVTKSRWADMLAMPEDDEQSTDTVRHGAWLARKNAPGLLALVQRCVEDSADVALEDASAYAADPFNVITRERAHLSGWEA